MSSHYSTHYRSSFKVLSFSMGTTYFAVEIFQIQEIIKICQVRKTPGTQKLIEGVISFREKILPIVDLRKLFNIHNEIQKDAKIIIYQIKDNQIGFIIDRAYQVMDIKRKDISPTPPVLTKGIPGDSFVGVFESNGRTNILLDFKELFSNQEQILFNAMNIHEL